MIVIKDLFSPDQKVNWIQAPDTGRGKKKVFS
jgi:hypothetical protein